MKKIAVLVAGGSGTRMGSDLPKQFIMLKGKPVLYYSLKAFLDTWEDLQVILVLPVDHTERGREIVDAYFDKNRVTIVGGGLTRFQSVKNGLSQIKEEAVIFVHDAVRCLVSAELIRRCFDKAVETGSAIPAIPSKDSIRLITDDGNYAFDRSKVMLIQTPQTFHSKILLPAYEIDFKEIFTDEATVVEAFGLDVSIVKGEEDNIKITSPVDLILAEKILEKGL